MSTSTFFLASGTSVLTMAGVWGCKEFIKPTLLEMTAFSSPDIKPLNSRRVLKRYCSALRSRGPLSLSPSPSDTLELSKVRVLEPYESAASVCAVSLLSCEVFPSSLVRREMD